MCPPIFNKVICHACIHDLRNTIPGSEPGSKLKVISNADTSTQASTNVMTPGTDSAMSDQHTNLDGLQGRLQVLKLAQDSNGRIETSFSDAEGENCLTPAGTSGMVTPTKSSDHHQQESQAEWGDTFTPTGTSVMGTPKEKSPGSDHHLEVSLAQEGDTFTAASTSGVGISGELQGAAHHQQDSRSYSKSPLHRN